MICMKIIFGEARVEINRGLGCVRKLLRVCQTNIPTGSNLGLLLCDSAPHGCHLDKWSRQALVYSVY